MVRLRTARLNAGLSLDELAARCGFNADTIRAIEAGRTTRPHPRTMRRIAGVLGLRISEIQEFGNGRHPPPDAAQPTG